MSAAFDAVVAGIETEDVDLGDIDELFLTFRTVQAAEAWRTHGAWIEAHPGALGEDVAARFAFASTITGEQEAAGREALDGSESATGGSTRRQGAPAAVRLIRRTIGEC